MHPAFTTKVLRSGQALDDRYVISGALILVCIGVFAFVGDGPVGRTITVALQGATLLEILHTSCAQAHDSDRRRAHVGRGARGGVGFELRRQARTRRPSWSAPRSRSARRS